MKSIKILDRNVNLLGIIDDYESFNLTRRFFKCGEFEFRINSNKLHTDKLQINNLILLGKDYNKVGIILHREFVYAELGEQTETLLIRGIMLQGLLKRRVILPKTEGFDSCNGSQETIMKYFVDKNCVNPTDSNRKIPSLVIAEDKKRGKRDGWRSSYENLADKLQQIGEYSNLGWNITLDHHAKNFVFDILVGKYLTTTQSTNPPVIFRSDFNNIKTRHYTESIINSKNLIYVGDKDNLTLASGQATGFERNETFTELNSSDQKELKKEGKVKLKELEELKTFELEINPTQTFIYEKDYDLGDVVTIQDQKLNVIMNSRIVEIQEIYTNSGMQLKVTFGKNIPTILDILRRQ